MIEIFRGYVKTKDKKPTQKFKGVDNLPTLDDVKNLDEYAGILNENFTVMDVDDTDEARRCYALVCDLDLNCRVVKTTRGMHFIFKKNNYASKGNTHQISPLGFTFDIRTGINQYIVVKKDGKLREVVREFDEAKPITEYPKYFAPIRSDSKFTGLKDGDGRNGKLFAHIATLTRNGYTVEEVRKIIGWINEYFFDDPLDEKELKMICRDESFKGLETFNVEEDFARPQYMPQNNTDISVAELFSRMVRDFLRYNPATGWLVWNGRVWELSDLKAQNKYIEFIKKVLDCAVNEITDAYKQNSEAKIKNANKFYAFAVKMNDAGKVASVLKLSRSLLEIDITELDGNPFELNTPAGIVNLKTGEVRAHDAESLCTKITNASPTNDLGEEFYSLLDKVTCGDKEYQIFLQEIAGAIVIGKVYNEALVIAHGGGANGKSTLFNTIAKVLGDYAGKMPAEALTTKAKNAKVDLAELFGKRFVLAGETEEGQRFSNSMLKQVASSDAISAEKKYHDPFSFEPTHTVLLYTNFLPRLNSLDNGTKRRIIVCPFNATIDKPVKDYAEKLLATSSGAIMKWIIEGAKKFIQNGYNLSPCKVCDAAKDEYIESNDWLSPFLAECCIVDKTKTCGGGALYKAYRDWCQQTGEFSRRNADFTEALRRTGFESKKTEKGTIWKGLCLDLNSKAAEDFL